MKLIPAVLLLTTLIAAAATEETVSKRFPVKSGGNLTVEVQFGSIEIKTNNTSEVTVDVYRKVGRKTQAEEEDYLKEYPVVFRQEGSDISVKVERENRSALTGWFGRSFQRNEAKYTITVPAKYNGLLKTSGGSISVSDLNGDLKARTSGGSLRFSRLEGTVDGHTSGGSIKLADCAGELKINTSGGGIDVNGGSGNLDGHTSGGSVQVRNFRGPAKVSTSGGGINLENIVGRLEGSTSGGSISASLVSMNEEVRLATSGGSVRVRVPETAALDLDAATSGGGVSSDLPVTTDGKKHRSSLKGTVNGGGKLMYLRTSGGSIHVQKL